MNGYFKNLKKIEFVVTNACTGKCKHCSQGNHISCEERIDPQIAADCVRKIAFEFDINTVMVFGGEPLLHFDAVWMIMNTAKELGIAKRQIITNGFFSQMSDRICEIAKRIAECGVNDLLLSVDAFHQETIPLDLVLKFANELKTHNVPVRLSPAWLVNKNDDNPYNRKTREIIDHFAKMNIPEGDGNIIFPEGNALIYLSEYFSDNIPKNPYIEAPFDIRCISFSSNGDVLNDNIYKTDIVKIIKNYCPVLSK